MKKITITQSITVAETETFKKYLKDISNFPILNDKEELMYANRAISGDTKALHLLINCNLRFVISVAKKYVDKDSKLEDLVNEGNLGLIEAAKRFDPTRGFKLISYAVWWIRDYIIFYKNNRAKSIRLPIYKISELNKVRYRIKNLTQELDREPTTIELFNSFKSGISLEKLDEITQLIKSDEQSLDEIIGDDSTTLLDIIPSDSESTDQKLIDDDEKQYVRNLVNILNDKEQYIMTRLYGLDGWSPLALEVLGEEVGISRESVRQIRNKSLDKMRKKFNHGGYE